MLSYFLAGVTIGPTVSQTLLDLMIFMIFVSFTKESFNKKFQNLPRIRKPYLFEYGIIFYLIAIVAGLLILGVTDPEAWGRLYRFNWILNFYLFIWAFSRYEIDLNKIIKFFSWIFIPTTIYSIISTIYRYDFIRQEVINDFRLKGILQSSTYHAHVNGLLLIFFLTLLFFKFKTLNRTYKALSIFAVLLISLGIFMTFTRGIWLSLFFSNLIFLAFQRRKLFVICLATGLIFIGILYSVSQNFRERVEHSLQTKVSDAKRWNLFEIHVLMIKDSPLIGIGYTNNLSHTPAETWLKYGFSTDNLDSHAHNQFLNVFATTGLLGFIPFMIFYFWFVIVNIKLVKRFKIAQMSEHYALAMACLMAQLEFFIANLTDVGFEYTKIRALILLAWALVFCLLQKRIQIAHPP